MLLVALVLVVKDRPPDLKAASLASTLQQQDAHFFSSVWQTIRQPIAWGIIVAELVTGVLRHGFEQWFPRYLSEYQGISLQSTLFQRGSVVIMGASIFGALIGGYASDRLFMARRTPVVCIAYLGQVVSLTLLIFTTEPAVVVACLLTYSLALGAIHSMLTGAASMDIGGQRGTATAAGLFDGAQYVGGSVAGFGLGKLLDHYGWNIWAPAMLLCALIGAVAVGLFWSHRPKETT